jgi:hypothetical protein
MRIRVVIALVAVAALLPSLAEAQRTTRRRLRPIEIRGQVPTPQVVTVRPRAVPAYSRQVLVPNFYDHDFWQSILPGYQIVARRAVTGQIPGDTTAGAAGVAGPGAPNAPAAAGVTRDTTGAPGRVPPATPPDTTRRPPGTTPARTPR